MKIVINGCYGGFGISNLAMIMLLRKKGFKELYFYELENNNSTNIVYKKISEEKCIEAVGDFKINITTKDFGDIVAFDPDDSTDKYSEFFESIIPICVRTGDDGRQSEELLSVIEELGTEKSSGVFSKLKIVEIPDDVEYEIEEYDGMEWVSEKHRTWR